MSGLLDLADCLKELHLKFKINHGDIHPDNILIDKNGQFYLVDFGLADITKTLSQTKELEIFARGFAAPEKLNKLVMGFPFQADIFQSVKLLNGFLTKGKWNLRRNMLFSFNGYLQKTLLTDQIGNKLLIH
ncbi:MAG: protein kinase family protein [Bacteroidota bacterium]|nr:MAG: protein kinase family protein [Bacteroidota bacterium]